jgi:hypothetical protein
MIQTDPVSKMLFEKPKTMDGEVQTTARLTAGSELS